jgi:hypothetical protein
MLIFASYRLRNRISSTPVAAMAMIMMAAEFTASMKSDGLASAARWRTACLMRGYKLVSHAEQVQEDIGCDAEQANQHGAVTEMVIGHIVNIRSYCQQFGSVVEADTNQKRTRLSRTMCGHARQ